jgi:beta-lactam-binding protein with PASTA domain
VVVVPRLNDSNSPRPSGVTVPSLVGQRLDAAEQRLDGLGLRSDEIGAGLFGVIFASDWEVCQTSPSAGTTVRPRSTVRLQIDRPGAC